jgi:hypothetical protein
MNAWPTEPRFGPKPDDFWDKESMAQRQRIVDAIVKDFRATRALWFWEISDGRDAAHHVV